MDIARNLRNLAHWVPIRFIGQTAVAALATLAIVNLLGLEETSWAVISALFIVQWSLDSSISIALGRIVGAVIGSFVGLVCIQTIGVGGQETVISLTLAVLVMSFISGLWPGLYYGLFAAAAMIIDPGGGGDVAESAMDRAMAISLGTAVGAMAASVVLPLPAHRSAEYHLGQAIRRCGDLLTENIKALIECDDKNLMALHTDLRTELYRAQGAVSASKYARRLDRRRHRPPPEELLRSVQRLWHSFSLIDRVEDTPLPDLLPNDTVDELKATAEACRGYLADLGDAVARNRAAREPEGVLHRLARIARDLERLCDGAGGESLSNHQGNRLHILALVLLEVSQHVEDLARHLGVEPEQGDFEEADSKRDGTPSVSPEQG